MSIPQETIDLIKERLSIVELISESISLRRVGRNFVGLCPFHNEKTPSFSVREEEGTFHCFGCEKSGTIFNFVMETRGFSFPEAVRFLASRAGVTIEDIPGRKQEDDKAQQHRRSLRELLAVVEVVFRDELQRSSKALTYLESRGLRPQTIEAFRLGYVPKTWEFILKRVHDSLGERAEIFGGISGIEALLAEVGLLKRRATPELSTRGMDSEEDISTLAADKGSEKPPIEARNIRTGTYDSFRERIIFPITRSDGAVIAFGGRTLESAPEIPKYINSSESAIYQKRKTLFGLHQAMRALRNSKQAILVEGYMDVISLAQNGISNVVATCGTAVSTEHVQVLRRLVERVLVVFDGDSAGRKAAARCYEVFLNSGLDVMAVLLPDGEDPDSYARHHSTEDCIAFFENRAIPLLHVFIDSLMPPDDSERTAASIGRAANAVSLVIARLKNPVEREFSLRALAEKLGVSVNSVEEMVHAETKRLSRRDQGFSARDQSSVGNMRTSYPITSQPPPFPPWHEVSTFTDQRTEASPQRRAGRPISKKRLPESRAERLPFLYRQLLVSVLCDPPVARAVLEMPSFLHGIAGSVGSPVSSEEPMPENVRAFLKELSSGEFVGVTRGGSQSDRAESLEAAYPELRDLLTKHDLEATRLLQEAFRQVSIGGGDPRKAVFEVRRATASEHVQQEVEVLKQQEVDASDEAGLEKLAQEKLMKIRMLQRLRPSGVS